MLKDRKFKFAAGPWGAGVSARVVTPQLSHGGPGNGLSSEVTPALGAGPAHPSTCLPSGPRRRPGWGGGRSGHRLVPPSPSLSPFCTGLDSEETRHAMLTCLKYRFSFPAQCCILLANGVTGLCSGRQGGRRRLAVNHVWGLAARPHDGSPTDLSSAAGD